MKKSIVKGTIAGFSVILLSLIAMYLGLVFYYRDGFSYGTWINGVYCTGKSINEVNEELIRQCSYEGLTITDCDGKSYTILPEDVALSYDYTNTLERYKQKQNPFLWIDNLIEKSGEKSLEPQMSYDGAAFENLVNQMGFLTGKREEDRVVRLQKGDKGYYLVNERVHVLDEELAYSLIKEAFEGFQDKVDLEAEGCYRDLPLTEEMKEQIALWDKLEDYQSCGIVYQLGDDLIPIDGSVVCNWLVLNEDGTPVLDEDGNLCIDEQMVWQFIDDLADEYDTVGKTRSFHATRGDIVVVEDRKSVV